MKNACILRVIAIMAIVLMLSVFTAGCKQKPKETDKEPEIVAPPQGRIAFGDPFHVTEKGEVFAPSLAVDPAGNVHIAYIRGEGPIHRVFIVNSKNAGDNFSHNIQLSEKDGIKDNGIVAGALDGSLYTMWVNKTDIGSKLVFRQSNDGGKIFTRETQFNGAKDPHGFSLTGDEKNPLVFYINGSRNDTALVLNKGFNRESEISLLAESGLKGVKTASITKGIYALALKRSETATGGAFILLSSTDGGKTFTPYTLFNGMLFPVFKNSFDIAVTREDTVNRLHMIWLERSGSGVRLMYARSMETVAKWTEPTIFAEVPRVEQWISDRPLLTTDGLQSVFIAYTYLNRASEIRYPLVYRFSEDGGMTFGEESTVTEQVTNPWTITGMMNRYGTVHMSWDDEDRTEPGNRRIYYIKGTVK